MHLKKKKKSFLIRTLTKSQSGCFKICGDRVIEVIEN